MFAEIRKRLARPKLTGSALLGVPFSDGDRVGTKPNVSNYSILGHSRFERFSCTSRGKSVHNAWAALPNKRSNS